MEFKFSHIKGLFMIKGQNLLNILTATFSVQKLFGDKRWTANWKTTARFLQIIFELWVCLNAFSFQMQNPLELEITK